MKTSKRILATIVAILLVMTSMTVPTFAAFTDLNEETAGYNAANVLNMLGIINGYPDGSFGPEKNVTRAEFTAMLLRTRGMGSVGSTSLENPPFPDVTTPDVSWAIANIRTAREMGIINGYDDGTFKPNNNVSYEEAIKMIVCALGYGEMGAEGAFWYSRYVMTATQLGFLEGAGGAISVPATRATIASMLYNCLEINLAENNEITDKTILENDLKLTKNTGYISSNSQISLISPEASLRDDEIEVVLHATGEKALYKVEDAEKYNDMLGAQITFYAATDKDSGYKTIISATVKDTNIVEIPSSRIEGYTDASIEYYESEDAQRTTIANIASDSVVIYNGKLYGTGRADSKFSDYTEGMPSIGNVKLLDRNDDSKFDVVFIDSYTTWVVSAVSTTSETITDNVLRKSADVVKQLSLKSADKVKILDVNGNEMQISAIKKDNVISVKKDNHSGITAIVTGGSVSGKITAISAKNGVSINGKNYKYSKQAPWWGSGSYAADSAALEEPQYGDSGKFYLDIDGNIIAYDKTESVVTQYYGYMIDADIVKRNGFDKTLIAYISTASNPTGKEFVVTTKTKINGYTSSDLEEALDTLWDGNRAGVKFTISKNDEIAEIATVLEYQEEGTKLEPNKIFAYENEFIDKEELLTYVSSASKELVAGYDKDDNPSGNDKIYIGNATIISAIDGKYKKMNVSDFTVGGKYTIEAFDVTNTGAAKFVVVHTASGGAAVGAVKATSPVMVITSVQGTTVDGDKAVAISGFVGADAKTDWILSPTDEDTQDSIAMGLKEGDVVRLGRDSDNYYTLKPEHIIFRTDGEPSGEYPKTEKVSSSIRYQIIWGSAYQYDYENGTRFIMSNNLLEDAEATPLSTTPLEKSWFKDAKIFMYSEPTETEDEKFEEVTQDYLNVLGSLTYTGSVSRPTEVFVYMTSANRVATLIVVNRAE